MLVRASVSPVDAQQRTGRSYRADPDRNVEAGYLEQPCNPKRSWGLDPVCMVKPLAGADSAYACRSTSAVRSRQSTSTIPIDRGALGFKKCRQCDGLSQSVTNCTEEFMVVGVLLEERQRPEVQSPFLITSRVSRAEDDDWSPHKIR